MRKLVFILSIGVLAAFLIFFIQEEKVHIDDTVELAKSQNHIVDIHPNNLLDSILAEPQKRAQDKARVCKEASLSIVMDDAAISKKKGDIVDLLKQHLGFSRVDPLFYNLLAMTVAIDPQVIWSLSSPIQRVSPQEVDPISSEILQKAIQNNSFDAVIQALRQKSIDPSSQFLVSSIEVTLFSILLDRFGDEAIQKNVDELVSLNVKASIYDLFEMTKRGWTQSIIETFYREGNVKINTRFIDGSGSVSLASTALMNSDLELYQFWRRQGSPIIGDLFNQFEFVWFSSDSNTLTPENRSSILQDLMSSELLLKNKLQIKDSSVNSQSLAEYTSLDDYLSDAEKSKLITFINAIFGVALDRVKGVNGRQLSNCYYTLGQSAVRSIFNHREVTVNAGSSLQSDESKEIKNIVVDDEISSEAELYAVFTLNDSLNTKNRINDYYLKKLDDIVNNIDINGHNPTEQQIDVVKQALELIGDGKWNEAERLLKNNFDHDTTYTLLLERALNTSPFAKSQAVRYIDEFEVPKYFISQLLEKENHPILEELLDGGVSLKELGFNRTNYYNHFYYVISFEDSSLLRLLLEHNVDLKQDAPGYDVLDYALLALKHRRSMDLLEQVGLLLESGAEIKLSHREIVEQIYENNEEFFHHLIGEYPELGS